MLRILLCRAAFICCVLLPTVVVAAWAVHRSQPAYRNARQEEWTRFIASRYGVIATVDRVTYPSYWVARIDNLQLADAESKAALLSCRTLEAARTKQGWVVEASQPEIRVDQLATFAELLEARVLRHAPEDTAPCEMEIGELTLRAGDQAQTVTHVSVKWSSTAATSELELMFRVAGIESPQPCRLVLKRNRGGSTPTTSWEFSTGNVALPCEFLAAWLPALKPLGKDARFVGRASGETSATSGRGEIDGRFLDLDLTTLFTDHSAHKLTGREVHAQVSPLKFQNGRITEIRGTLESNGGYVSESFVIAAREHLRLGVDKALPPVQDGLLPYGRLAFGFRLDSTGLTLEGSADVTRNGVIFSSASGPLLLDPTEQPLPAAAFLRALAPQTGVQVPAARETQPLLDIFPAPSVQPPPKAPRVKVRLGGGIPS